MEDEDRIDEAPVSPPGSPGSSASSDDSSGSEIVETLIAGRERRTTAANRYDSSRVREEFGEDGDGEDDEINLLFAEEGEDDEFEGSEAEDADGEMDSSSDDDQGPNAAENELEGEKELERQQRLERAKKRKVNLALTTGGGLRKRVKIDPNLPRRDSDTSKPSKKKERSSFLPSGDTAPSRMSQRKQTVAHREETHAKIREGEKAQAKSKVRREKAEREREKNRPVELTQADRMAEAEKIERKNAKSLNRWEAKEKQKAEEQAAKLAALRDRKIEGPVISWWSGIATWTGPKLTKVGSIEVTLEPKPEGLKRGRKPKAYLEQLAAAKLAEAEQLSFGTPREGTATPALSESAANTPVEATEGNTPIDAAGPQITFATPRGPGNFLLPGIPEFASTAPESAETAASAPVPESSPAPAQVQNLPTPPQGQDPPNPGQCLETPTQSQYSQASAQAQYPALPVQGQYPPNLIQGQHLPVLAQGQYQPTPAQLPPTIENSTRNLVIMIDFDDLNGKDRAKYAMFYNSRKMAKPTKATHELCPITSLPARYRDPATGVHYASAFAYKTLQSLKKHNARWSSMLGCFVGQDGLNTRVPEGFYEP